MAPETSQSSSVMLNKGTYDLFKRSVQLGLPALGALYFTLAQIWGLPKSEEVVGTAAAINLFLGVMVTISHQQYTNSDARFDGSIDVAEMDEKKVFSLNLDSDPNDLEGKDQVIFKVKSKLLNR